VFTTGLKINNDNKSNRKKIKIIFNEKVSPDYFYRNYSTNFYRTYSSDFYRNYSTNFYRNYSTNFYRT